MKKLAAIKSLVNPSEEEVRSYLSARHIRESEGLVKFFVEQNVVYVKEDNYYVDGEEDGYEIRFYPFASTDEITTFQNVMDSLFEDFYQAKYLPFGYDTGGWQYVVSVASESLGKVFFSRMDTNPPGGLSFLANSLCEFINKLEPYREEVI